MSRIIFLDIDGTLLPHSLEQWFIGYLWRHRLIHPKKLLIDSLALVRIPFHTFQMKLFYLRGFQQQVVQNWIEDCWQHVIQRHIYPVWYEVIPWLQSHNVTVVLLSGTLMPLAEPLKRLFGIDKAICAEPQVVGGNFTGRLVKPHPKGRYKSIYAQEFLSHIGSSWKETLAIANSWQDRFLFYKSHPLVVCPGFLLSHLARAKGWKIITDLNDSHHVMAILQQHFISPK